MRKKAEKQEDNEIRYGIWKTKRKNVLIKTKEKVTRFNKAITSA